METGFISKEKKSPLENLLGGLKTCPDGPFLGLTGALAPILLGCLAQRPQVTLVVTKTSERARWLAEETRSWLGNKRNRVALFLPYRDSIYDQTLVGSDLMRERVTSLGIGVSGGGVVITPTAAICERFVNPGDWRRSCLKIASGTPFRPQELSGLLTNLGYKRVNLVEEAGQFALRGGLIDVFSPNHEVPMRLDFFGDEVEVIKTFSPETQRTLEKKTEITVTPFLEFIPSETTRKMAEKALENAAAKLDATRQELLLRRYERFVGSPDSQDLKELWPFLEKGKGFLWEYWDNRNILIEDQEQLDEEILSFMTDQEKNFERNIEQTPLLPAASYYHAPDILLEALKAADASFFSRFKRPNDAAYESVLLPGLDAPSRHGSGLNFSVEPVPAVIDPSRESLIKDLHQWTKNGWAVAVAIENEQRFHSLKELLGERKVPLRSSIFPMSLSYGFVLLFQGATKRGFISEADRIAVLGEEDIFPHQARSIAKPGKTHEKPGISLAQLVPGDLVVHVDHGIAEYRGIHEMTAAGNSREYLLLQYAGSDKLYVPTDQLHKVQKYIGMEGSRPAIHGLNSKLWESQKRRVQKNVEIIARELLELYAKRHSGAGFAFLPDGEFQKDLEKRFPYTETPDQLKAIEATTADMEAAVPMDRLICGDVGYGKTEVAIRAAFKAVCSGKQVAVLAPTTLLAFQHQQTFSARLKGFPVRLDMISRLKKPAEIKTSLENTKLGLVDILIGTHRILSHDVNFKDLGLLVVDEEQRFGVKHKERIKSLKTSVDVLTLTATPIPRTLQMALSGIRQISVIDTPPEDRRSVHTYVAPFDASWTKRAIIEEMKRGGQIYYVYNRVERIEQKAAFLRDLVPEARIAIAHGQMDEQIVERTMLAFINREYDILLATTIIESGLDIPNVNTLIVDEAERLGLSQMYQLRGRVGRSSRQAWAYFFYSKGKRLTREAQERLSTIEEHTALGSGFKIALRDLQIRGAGNLLGEEQSGHIAAVGFSLFMELLEEAVNKLKGKPLPKPLEAGIEIPVTALFPPAYIPEEETRIDMYARLARCADLNALEMIKIECCDRFGSLPNEALRLFTITRLRILAALGGVKKVTKMLNRLRFEFDANRQTDVTKLVNVRAAFFQRITLNPADPNAINLALKGEEGDQILTTTEKFLQQINEIRAT